MTTESQPLISISLGAGVQSSVLALRHREFGGADVAIFADTDWESPATYAHLDWLEAQLDIPLVRVKYRSLRLDLLDSTGSNVPLLPSFIGASKMTGRRHCTTQYKIKPIQQELRRQLGIFGRRTPPGILVTQWLGISLDEAQRIKPSREPWIEHRWPLIEARLTRRDCLAWLAAHFPDRVVPRSACQGCPYQSKARWLELAARPDALAEAVAIDRNYRAVLGRKGVYDLHYLHPLRRPLDEAIAIQQMQGSLDLDGDGWGNECEGVCGV